MLTAAHIKSIMPQASAAKISAVLPWLNKYLPLYKIDTPARVSAFLAQIALESGQLNYFKELWGPTSWQVKYEGKKDLGNIFPGDGKRFMGRALIQVTGRANYEAFGNDFFNNKKLFTDNPELLETPQYAVLASVWFWTKNKLNVHADKGDFKTLTERINPAKLHYEQRVSFWEKAKAALKNISPAAAATGGAVAIGLLFFFF